MIGTGAERRIGGILKIHMKIPSVDLVQDYASAVGTVNSEQKLVSARGRRIAGAKARGNEAVKRWIGHGGVRDEKADSVCRAAAKHRPTIKGINAYAFEIDVGKNIDCQ